MLRCADLPPGGPRRGVEEPNLHFRTPIFYPNSQDRNGSTMAMNHEVKKVIDQVKLLQGKLQKVASSQDWVEEARKYANKQRQEVKKLFASDAAKVKTFIERERKELERFQKQIPGEVKKVKDLIARQRRDLEKLLTRVRKANIRVDLGKKSGGGKKSGAKKASGVIKHRATKTAAAVEQT